MTARSTYVPCEECGGKAYPNVSLKGMATCTKCGKLFVIPPEVAATIEQPEVEAVTEPSDRFEIPDYTEPMIGWRAWGVPVDDFVPRLWSVTHYGMWEPREPMVATCDRGKGKHTHEPPGRKCRCGLYAAKTRKHLMSMQYPHYDGVTMWSAMGTVSLWGTGIVEGNQGWRAPIGYPRELWVPFEAWRIVEPLSEAYGVPVRLSNIIEAKISQ